MFCLNNLSKWVNWHFQAAVIHVGCTSMEVGIRLIAEDIAKRTLRLTNTCYVTMVAVDDGKPTAVKPLELNTEKEKRWYRNAQLRICLRDRYREEHEKQSESGGCS